MFKNKKEIDIEKLKSYYFKKILFQITYKKTQKIIYQIIK